jgi:cell division protein FtsB
VTAAADSGGNGRTWLSTRLVAVVTGILSLALVGLVFFSHRGVYQTYRLRQEKARLDAENHRLAEENARLARIIDRLHHDQGMIQDLIRRELNFVKKNEVIIQLPPRPEEAPDQAALLPLRSPAATGGKADQSRPQGRPQPAPASRKTRP